MKFKEKSSEKASGKESKSFQSESLQHVTKVSGLKTFMPQDKKTILKTIGSKIKRVKE